MLQSDDGPARRASGLRPTPHHTLPAEFPAGLRVLVADDNPVNLMLAVEMLALLGVHPLLAGDGAQAVAVAAQADLDLILMDLQMPVLDGLSATRQIRKIEQEQNRARVPVLAYTTSPPETSLLRECGLDGEIDKPCSIGQLSECLRHWCRPSHVASSTGH
jgi:CheY-like chemotaxis protein